MLTFLLAAALIGLLLTAGWAFQSLNEGHLRRYFLTHRSLTTGYWVCGVVAMGTLLFWTIAGAFFGPYGVLAGFIIGLFTAAQAAAYFWNAGVKRVRLKHRAVPVWRGTRQPDPKLEMPEGTYWLFPWFFSFDEFEMKEYTDKVVGIPIEVADENTVPTDITLQWKPKKGSLWNFGNLDDPTGSFESELKEVARAFGVSRNTIDSVIDKNYPELLKTASLQHLQRRANGEVNSIEIDPTTGAASFKPIPGAKGSPWGIDFVSASVPNFTLPLKVTEAAAEITAATKRVDAAKVEIEQIDTIADRMTSQRGMQPTAAASLAASMVLPSERRPNLITHNHVIEGLDGVVRTMVNGALVYLGKEPLPGMTLTPPVTANPQEPAPTTSTATSDQKTEKDNHDQQST